jgi:hypothetical protein
MLAQSVSRASAVTVMVSVFASASRRQSAVTPCADAVPASPFTGMGRPRPGAFRRFHTSGVTPVNVNGGQPGIGGSPSKVDAKC